MAHRRYGGGNVGMRRYCVVARTQGSTGEMREEDDEDGHRGGTEVTWRRRRRGQPPWRGACCPESWGGNCSDIFFMGQPTQHPPPVSLHLSMQLALSVVDVWCHRSSSLFSSSSRFVAASKSHIALLVKKGWHGDGKRQQGDRRHDNGDEQQDVGNERHDNGKGQQGVRRKDNGNGRQDDGKGQQGDRRHNISDGQHDNSKGWHGDGKRQQGGRQHDNGDGQPDRLSQTYLEPMLLVRR